jgi:hypothetical protein
MFEHTRTPDPAWERSLATLAPRSDRLPWLKLVWMPGETYEPVQRWVIYELFPNLSMINQSWIDEMHNAPPRQNGVWYTDEFGTRRWRSVSLVSRIQYDLFHQYQAWPQLTWIIQGHDGGHLWNLTQPQLKLWQLRTGLRDWPAPGELPYADFSGATLRGLRHRDKLRAWDEKFNDWEKRYATNGVLDLNQVQFVAGRTLEEERIELNAAVAKWLEGQFDAVADSLTHRTATELLATGSPDVRIPEDEIEEEWIRG